MQNITTKTMSFNKKVKLNFDGGELSSDSGLLLVHEFCQHMGVLKLLEEYLPEDRGGGFLHQKPEIIYEELLRIIAGYPSNNSVIQLKEDPVFQQIHHNNIASSSTCCRLEKTFTKEDVKRLQKVQNILLDRVYSIEPPEEMWLDLDTTYDPASSSLYGSNYNTHYGETGFSPLLCFNGKNGDFLKGFLRPGNYYCSRNIVIFLEPLLKKYRKLGSIIKSRADSGFACPQFYELNEKYDAQYYVKLKMNAVLKRTIEARISEEEEKEGFGKLRTQEKEIFFEFQYAAKSWSKKRRILARVQWKGGELFPVCSAIVTNDIQCTPQEGFAFYNGRAVIENYIEEGKNGFSWDHLSHKNFENNSVKFQIYLTAYLIVQLFRRICVPLTKEKSTVQTLRIMLFKVASKIVKNGRYLIFKCASAFHYKTIFLETLENIQDIPDLLNRFDSG